MKKNRMGLWVAIVGLVGLAAGCCREPSSLVLAERGRTGYAIVRDESLGKDYDFVVKDFADLLEKATGAKFPVIAPSAASLADLEQAMTIFTLCVKKAALEKILG